ncbi:Uncharacterised protein [Bordetella pertussis]|nr:Uncharacterised protein [Bordetella pertussis]CFW45997.1 Uncharacterised protein [Bordetella pertussis]
MKSFCHRYCIWRVRKRVLLSSNMPSARESFLSST